MYQYKSFFANDWIRTADLWYQKRPLYQLSHNHCPLYVRIEDDFTEALIFKLS